MATEAENFAHNFLGNKAKPPLTKLANNNNSRMVAEQPRWRKVSSMFQVPRAAKNARAQAVKFP